MNYNVLAMLDEGTEITIRTTETLKNAGPYLLDLHRRKLIELETPNSLYKGPQMTKKVTFTIKHGFPINEFVQTMAPIICRLTIDMTANAVPIPAPAPREPITKHAEAVGANAV